MGKTILITGANGEIGHGLIDSLSSKDQVIALDLNPLDSSLSSKVSQAITGSILDKALLQKLFNRYSFDNIFHLAALLSTHSENDLESAHQVNTEGSLNLLLNAETYAKKKDKSVVFMFPSSIAVYGLDHKSDQKTPLHEGEYLSPQTMYGCNKLYVELLGAYFEKRSPFIDFRGLRFPGLLSSETLPTGGTSDFGPEILHAAAQGIHYECFARSDTKIPFMSMPDAVQALIMLSEFDKKALTQNVYNVASFSSSASDITEISKKHFPHTDISYKTDTRRQKILDSWPEDIDDSKAKRDWGWKPKYDSTTTFEKYLIPAIKRRYSSSGTNFNT